ncbi:site-specific integrase [Corynebacterium sp. zg-331]|uniref:tyrosine-type recombinase/integrase n=1 Tax=unclassified Corynebacterium TaxID=2624378 RepID=UPI00128B8614|nr:MULTISPECIES: site-specific integrase [unclassified Corynebacterium]MBC3186316.1 site-specific integrase [Corynebacterium sp. zg-331]MPV52804.1 tyrosine-type recombinase/integrase [Corynebacterium sp. zg331]
MAQRRSFGEISKLPSGRYRARYTGPDGRRHKAPQTYHSRDDAAGWLRQQEKLIEFDAWTPPESSTRTADTTVGEWLTKWLDMRRRGTTALEPSTWENYEKTLRWRILDTTGDAAKLRAIPLSRLTRRDVASWWDAITTTFDTPPTNRAAYLRLHTAIQAAVDRDLITTNPVSVPDARKRPTPHRKDLPEADVMNAITDALDHRHPRIDGRYKIIAILTFFHGLRIGEALGLRRRDITDDGDTITIHIKGNAYRSKDGGMIRKDTTKTTAGYRDVPIFARFHNDIRWHLTHITRDHPDAPLCATAEGNIVMDTSYRTTLTRAKQRAGYADVRLSPHYGRVWLITTLAEAGMPIPAVGEILGQRDLRTITEVYMRYSKAARDQILDQVNQKILG